MIFTNRDKRTNLEKEIDRVIDEMSKLKPESKEYSTMSENLVKLNTLKDTEKSCKVKPDTKWLVGGNLIGLGLILGYEKINIITSKAMGYLIKGRA